MITTRERKPNKSATQFREWASMFSEGIFVILKVYGDETGTNDITGQQPGSAVPALSGLMDTSENWTVFCKKWRRTLDSYNAEFFHLENSRISIFVKRRELLIMGGVTKRGMVFFMI